MCGRFSLSQPKKIKAKIVNSSQFVIDSLKPRYNIAPSQQIAAILNEPERKIVPLKWGLIPSWAKDPSIGARMINARAETLAEKPSFKGLLHKHRCAIFADGFYEWMDTGKGKQPYFIHMKDGKPFTFAGLWSHWQSPSGEEVRTCAIITCPPNKLMSSIHDRMPVILSDEAREAWIDPANVDGNALTPLLKPYPDAEMEAYTVSKMVNSPMNDIKECLEQVKAIKTLRGR